MILQKQTQLNPNTKTAQQASINGKLPYQQRNLPGTITEIKSYYHQSPLEYDDDGFDPLSNQIQAYFALQASYLSLFDKTRFISFGYQRFILPFVVTKDVIKTVKEAYPELTLKRVLKLFYLVFNTKRCRNNSNPVITCNQISMAVRGKPWSRDFCCEKYLKLLQDIMGGSDYFEWSDWSYKERLARTVVRFVLKPEVEQALKKSRRQIRKKGYEGLDLVDVRTGRKWKPNNKKTKDNEQTLDYLLPGLCSDAIEFCEYYNENESVRRKINLLLKQAYKKWQKYIFNIINNEINEGASRERMVQCFTACLDNQEAPYYQASKNGKTVRIHPKGESFLGLVKRIRQILCIGCWDLDLTNAHPVIYATIRQVKGLLEIINSDRVVYKVIFDQLKKKYPQLEYTRIKRYIKAAFNALLNGAKKTGIALNHTIFPEISKLYPEIDPKDLRNKFFRVPIVVEVYSDTRQWLAEIKRNGCTVTDAYGNKFTNKKQPHKLMASVLQSWEMKLIKPVYSYINENQEKITGIAHQHDGVAVKIKDKRRAKGIIEQIKHRVEQEALRQGFKIKLEAEELTEEKLITEETTEIIEQQLAGQEYNKQIEEQIARENSKAEQTEKTGIQQGKVGNQEEKQRRRGTNKNQQSEKPRETNHALLVMMHGGKAQNYNNHAPLTPVEKISKSSQDSKPLDLDVSIYSDRSSAIVPNEPVMLSDKEINNRVEEQPQQQERIERRKQEQIERQKQEDLLFDYKKCALDLAKALDKHYSSKVDPMLYITLANPFSMHSLEDIEVTFNQVIQNYPLAWKDCKARIDTVGTKT